MVIVVEVVNVNQDDKLVIMLEWIEGWMKRLVGNLWARLKVR